MSNLTKSLSVKEFCLSVADSYTYDLELFFRYLDEAGLAFTFDSLERYKAHLLDRHLAASTVNKRVAAVKHRLKLLLDRESATMPVVERYRIESLLQRVKPVRKQQSGVGSEKIISPADYMRLARSVGPTALIVRCLGTTGLRISELLRLTVQDVTERGAYVDLRVLGKGSKERVVKLDAKLYERVRETWPSNEALFAHEAGVPLDRIAVTLAIRRLAKRVIGRTISAHVLRHYFATEKIRQTGKIKAVSQYLGHATTAITLDMYAHEALSWDDLVDSESSER